MFGADGQEVSPEDDTYNVDFWGKAGEEAKVGGERLLPDHDRLAASVNAPHSRLGLGAARPRGTFSASEVRCLQRKRRH